MRFTPHAGAGYITSRQRPNDEIDVRVRHVTTSGDGGLTFAAGPRLSLDVDASRQAVKYDDDDVQRVARPHDDATRPGPRSSS